MTTDRFNESLKRQLEILWRSCRDFDAGHTNEAIQMAVILRVIFHTTNHSTSILSHLNATSIKLITACKELVQNISPKVCYEGGLLSASSKGWGPKLNRTTNYSLSPFKTWWDEEAVSANFENVYTRKQIVLDTANKDDGAHVVPQKPKRLESLIEGPWTYITPGKENESNSRSSNHHFQYIRQICYEVLHSDELLDLVHPGFRLTTDEEVQEKQENQRLVAIEDAKKLHEAGLKLFNSGSNQDAHNLANLGLDKIRPIANIDTLEIYGLLTLLLAATFDESDHANRKKTYLELIGQYDRFLNGPFRSLLEVENYVKAHNCLADHLRDLDDFDGSKSSYGTVYMVTRQFFSLPDKQADQNDFGPLFDLLTSKNNLGVFDLNGGNYDSVVETIAELKKDLESYSINLWGASSITKLFALFQEEQAKNLIKQIIKAQANLVLALIAKRDESIARTAFAVLKAIVGDYSDEYVESRIMQIELTLK